MLCIFGVMSGEDGSGDSVSSYLGNKGAIELLCEIKPNGSQFTQLVEESPVSRSTVSTRLQEAEKLGLYERHKTEGRGTSHTYQLTETGARLRIYLDHTGITERYRTIKVLRQQFDEGVEELTGWARENEEKLEPPVEECSFRQHLRRYSDFES